MAHDQLLRTYRSPERLHRHFSPGFFEWRRTRKSGRRVTRTDHRRARRKSSYATWWRSMYEIEAEARE